jgi:hypothetical protein
MNSVPIQSNIDRMGRIVMQAMEEILGQNEVDAVLDLAHHPEYRHQLSTSSSDLRFSFESIGQFQASLERVYGSLAGRGLCQRVGRACLKYSLRKFGPGLGVTDLPFRLLPFPARLKAGCEALTGLFNQVSDQHVSLEMDKKYVYFRFERCLLCKAGQARSSRCALVVGFLQEALYWVSGGKYFLVEEKNCIACGDTECTIVIDQAPMS